MTARRRALGRAGEEAAAAWYRGQGYVVLDQNWRAPRGTGELDLVVATAAVVVFCEVKTRSSDRYGSGFAAVDPRKQRRVRALAVQWLGAQHQHWDRLRFDVVDVDARGHLQVLEAAF